MRSLLAWKCNCDYNTCIPCISRISNILIPKYHLLPLQSPLESFINATHFLGEDSPCFVNCFTHSHQSSTVACGSIHYGYHEVSVSLLPIGPCLFYSGSSL